MSKRNRHSKAAANLSVNRRWKRVAFPTIGNRAFRRSDLARAAAATLAEQAPPT